MSKIHISLLILFQNQDFQYYQIRAVIITAMIILVHPTFLFLLLSRNETLHLVLIIES